MHIPDSPRHDELRAYLMQAYARCVASRQPADQLLGGFLRQKDVPAAARGFLGAALFSMLRSRVRLLILAAGSDWPGTPQAAAARSPRAEAVLATALWLRETLEAPLDEAMRVLARAAKAWPRHPADGDAPSSDEVDAARAFLERRDADPDLAGSPPDFALAATHSVAPEILARWIAQFGRTEAGELAAAMQQPAPLTILANRWDIRPAKLLAYLEKGGLSPAEGLWSPAAIRIGKKTNLAQVSGLQHNWYEVQDEASQLVGMAVDDQPGWRVLDACAGAGGKSMFLSWPVGKEGRVFAHDAREDLLKEAAKRFERWHLKNAEVIPPGAAASQAPFDAVLIDAPCTGLGRLRREPSIAWRQPLGEMLAEANALQRECLASYAPLVKPGGVLVYATCSFEPEETTAMLDWFCKEHRFRPDPLPGPFAGQDFEGLRSRGGAFALTLPHRHGSDGFFIGRMRNAGE